MDQLWVQPSCDTYGRVKSLHGTAVITGFFALNSFPCVPKQSFYVFPKDHTGAEEVALELQRIDRTSAAMAYARGLFGALVVVGFIGAIFTIVMALCGPNRPLDDLGLLFRNTLLICLVAGLLGGIVSYWIPLVGRRERKIRAYCGQLCMICVDPAVLRSQYSSYLHSLVERTVQAEHLTEQRQKLLLSLFSTRSRLAEFPGNAFLEAETDQLLQQLDELTAKPTA
jgi:hypothetical protein